MSYMLTMKRNDISTAKVRGWLRSSDLPIRSRVLFQLSYTHIYSTLSSRGRVKLTITFEQPFI